MDIDSSLTMERSQCVRDGKEGMDGGSLRKMVKEKTINRDTKFWNSGGGHKQKNKTKQNKVK